MVLALTEKRGINIYDDVGVEQAMTDLFGDPREIALYIERLLDELLTCVTRAQARRK